MSALPAGGSGPPERLRRGGSVGVAVAVGEADPDVGPDALGAQPTTISRASAAVRTDITTCKG
jgi:hypothetical protein